MLKTLVVVVLAGRYPPEGDRGCGFRRGVQYGALPFEDYWEASKHDPIVLSL